MKIAVFGGTGMIGSRVVAEARSRGHEVSAYSRRGGERRPRPLTPADATRVAPIAAAQRRRRLGPRARSRDAGRRPVGLRRRGAPAGRRRSAPTRLVVVGGAGSLLRRTRRPAGEQPGVPAGVQGRGAAAADALDALRERGPSTDWTFLSPAPVIAPGERTGKYVLGADEPAGAQISAEDFAVALVDELEDSPARAHAFHRRQLRHLHPGRVARTSASGPGQAATRPRFGHSAQLGAAGVAGVAPNLRGWPP